MSPEATEIIASALGSLTALLQGRLRSQDFEGVAEVADLAARLKVILEPMKPDSDATRTVDATSSGECNGARIGEELTYPRFEIADDRLVKIGWSKRDRTEYEHKTPRSAVAATFRALTAANSGRREFAMDDVLPIVDDGVEVPAYQAYVVLAWLRAQRLVVRVGKSSYSLVKSAKQESALETAWTSTPRRS